MFSDEQQPFGMRNFQQYPQHNENGLMIDALLLQASQWLKLLMKHQLFFQDTDPLFPEMISIFHQDNSNRLGVKSLLCCICKYHIIFPQRIHLNCEKQKPLFSKQVMICFLCGVQQVNHQSGLHVLLINLHSLKPFISISLFDFYIRCKMSDTVIMLKQGSGLLQNRQIQMISLSVIFLWQSASFLCFSVAVHHCVGEMQRKAFCALIYKDPICDPLQGGDQLTIVIKPTGIECWKCTASSYARGNERRADLQNI